MGKEAIQPREFEFFDYRRYSFSLGLKTDECTWLSGHSAVLYDAQTNGMVIGGSLREQAEIAHAKIAAILAAAELEGRDIIKITDYVALDAIDAYDQIIDLRRKLFGERLPSATTIVVDRLLRPGGLIEVEVVAAARPAEVFYERESDLARAAAVRINDLVYVSAQLAWADGRRIAAPGDLSAQTEQVYRNIARVLEKAGLSTRHIVRTLDFLHKDARSAYRETAEIRRKYLAEPYPASTGVIVSRLPHPDALIQVDAIAYDGPRDLVNPGWSFYDRLTFSPAVRAGGYIFLSGQFAMDWETMAAVAPGDIVGQTLYVYRNILRVLKAARLDASCMVKTVEFVTASALERYRATAEVRKNIFPLPHPAATGVVVNSLLRPEMMIEVDSIALVK